MSYAERYSDVDGARGLIIRSSTVLTTLAALTMLSGGIVYFEPAPTDACMMALIAAMLCLGQFRLGPVAALQFLMWCLILAGGFIATTVAIDLGLALRHQLIALFLVVGALALSAFVRVDPARRFEIVMTCYVVAIGAASLFAVLGYLNLIPGAAEILTLHGRGRGTFKDPNVLGAAIVPALTFLAWKALREPGFGGPVVLIPGLVLALGLVATFSRGAWLAGAIGILTVVLISSLTGRRRTDRRRLMVVLTGAGLALVVGLYGLLQVEQVRSMMIERASLTQTYDEGPEGRFGGQQKALDLIVQHPIGIGAQTFSTVHHSEAPHNVYLNKFLNSGWLGGFFYILSVAATLGFALRGALRPGQLQGAFAALFAAALALAIEGLIIDTDNWRHLFVVFGLIWGLAEDRTLRA